MKRKLLYLSFFIMLVSLLIYSGGTLSLFTAADTVEENKFTAGTVIVDAGDSEGRLILKDDINGSKQVELELTNTGSKYSYIRALFEGGWNYTYHKNTAQATVEYETGGGSTGVLVSPSDSAQYFSASGSSGNSGTGSYVYNTSPLSWFTAHDKTEPLQISPSYSSLPGDDGNGETSNGAGGTLPTITNQNSSNGNPIVDGLFYAKVDPQGNIDQVNGTSDADRYGLYAIGTLGSKMYTYVEGKTLYVAVVVSRAVNDNVFDDRSGLKGNEVTPYQYSAGWINPTGNSRPFNHLVNSENMGFAIELCDGSTLSWQQWYATQVGGTWVSNSSINDPRILASATSIVWNMNRYESLDSANRTWDMYVHGTSLDQYKSPFNTDFPDDVTRADFPDGYNSFPPSQSPGQPPITFSYKHQWEWSMVYEFAFDLGECADLGSVSILNTNVHHSPSKGGETDEYFTPRMNFKKYVSVDGGTVFHDANSAPYPVLPAGMKPVFKFVLTNSGELPLEVKNIYDDQLEYVYLDSRDGSVIIPVGQKHEFFYPKLGENWDETIWVNYLSSSMFTDSDRLDFRLCTCEACAESGWVKYGEYFYYLNPVGPGQDTAPLCVVATPYRLESAYLSYTHIWVKAYVEAVQASNNAINHVWFNGEEPPNPPLNFVPKP